MKPIALALTGLAMGVTAVLPLARPAGSPDVGVSIAPAAAPPAPTSPSAHRLKAPARTVTVTGPVVATRYGPVQVRVVLSGKTLVSADAIRLPNGDDQTRSINRVAGPALARQAVASQGTVDGVSGATWTSNGYRRSLQAALDAARAVAATSVPTA